jgi:putative DNA primase/helicase
MSKRKTDVVWRASAERPCEACGSGTKGCSGLQDGTVLCRGEIDTAVWQIQSEKDGFHLLRPVEDLKPQRGGKKKPTPVSPPPAKPTLPPSADLLATAKHYSSDDHFTAEQRELVGAQLGVPPSAFALVPLTGVNGVKLGEDAVTKFFTTEHPECDADGTLINLVSRDPQRTPKYLSRKGLPRGLSLPAAKPTPGGRVYIPEGPTDTLAILASGLFAFGRPGSEGKEELIAEYIRKHIPAECEIVFVAENDKKDDGKWPGLDNAIKTAKAVATLLKRPVRYALVPDGVKDARAWLNHPDRGSTPYAERGKELGERLYSASVPELPGETTEDITKWNDEPHDPHRLARLYIASITPEGSPLRLRYWREQFHEWSGGCYTRLETSVLSAKLNRFIRAEFKRVRVLEHAAWENKGSNGPRPIHHITTPHVVNSVIAALAGECLVEADAPAWIDGTTGPDPKHLVAVRNGLYDLRTSTLHSPTPSFFSFAVAPFEYDPAAPPPAEWLRFLSNLWPYDPESIACLQEWFGYLLTPDTSQQKLLFILGPKRAGKGTIARVLKGLVGDHGFTGPTLSGLGTEYGLWPLLDKSIALISDARLSGRTDTAAVVERILSITGEDTITVNRKNLTLLDTRLTARFVILSNELPNLTDASGALPGRMILLRLTRTFYGDEDTGLIDKLLPELPGILNWAIQGYHRLARRGRFVQPASSRQVIREMEDIGSPVSAFVRQRCRLAANAKCTKSDLYEAWKKWCERNGKREPGIINIFGRNLMAAFPNVDDTKVPTHSGRKNGYSGIALLGELEEDNDEQDGEDALYEHDMQDATSQNPPVVSGLSGMCPESASFVRTAECAVFQPVSTDLNGVSGVSGQKHTPGSHAREHDSLTPTWTSTRCPDSPDTPDTPAHGVTSWLYVSRRLDMRYLPSSTLPVCEIGQRLYYRMSPEVLAFVEHCGNNLACNNAPESQILAFTQAKVQIDRFCESCWPIAELNLACSRPPLDLDAIYPAPERTVGP